MAGSIVRWKFGRRVLLPSPEFEDLPEHSWRHRRNRIDAEHRLAGRTHHLVGYADETLIAAAAEEEADDGNLTEHVVQPVHRNEGAAHAHLIARIIYAALDGGSDGRAFHDTLPDRELAVLARELRAEPRERNAVLRSGRRAGGDPIERTLPFEGGITDVAESVLCAGFDGRRIHRQLKLTADHLGVSVGEAEECSRVIGIEIDDVAPLPFAAQIPDQRRIAPQAAAKREVSDHSIASRQLAIEAAQRFTVMSGDRAELQVQIDVDVLGFALGIRVPARNRGLEKAAAIEDIAPHDDFHHAV